MTSSQPSSEQPTADSVESVLIRVNGMHCAGCVGQVEKAAKCVPGVVAANVNLAAGDALIKFQPSTTQVGAVVKAVNDAGFSASLSVDSIDDSSIHVPREGEDLAGWDFRVRLCVWLMVGLLIISLWPYFASLVVYAASLLQAGIGIRASYLMAVLADFIPPLQLLFGTLLYAFVGFPFVWRALRQLRYLHLNMDTLIAIGVTVAFGHGVYQVLFGMPSRFVFLDVGMIAGFVSFGRLLELKSRRKATRAVTRLLTLTPPVATVIDKGEQAVAPLKEVRIGDTILIKAGDRVPLDATIVTGESTADEAWLTGESRTITKKNGDQVFAGSLNLSGSLTARVTATNDNTYLSRIIELVRTAQCSKASVQRFADRAAFWFVPVVLLLAVATLLTWGLALNDWNEAVQRAVAVVIVSCPCALGLATPTAIMAACQRGAQEGILIKDAQALETAGRLSCILLDKTGTVTQGQSKVIAANSVGEPSAEQTNSARDWLRLAAAAEQHANHPLAAAIVSHVSNAAEGKKTPLPQPTNSESFLGEGIRATVNSRDVVVGNERLLRRLRVPVDESQAGAAKNQTLVHVAVDGVHAGRIVVRSATDPHGRKAIQKLKRMGLVTMIVSGDREDISNEVGAEIDVDSVVSQAKPDDKHALVKKMQAAGHRVAMIGDGINDAPALAAADLGVAMGAGADVALETADVVLARGDMRQLLTVVRLARATLSTIRWNLVWAVGYNLLLIPLASGLLLPLIKYIPFGWLVLGRLTLPPSLAAAAMAASSISVVSNSLRLATRTDI